jgi:hypothetical protein
MQLVENDVFPRSTAPSRCQPAICLCVDQFAPAFDVLRLVARSRVCHERAIMQCESVSGAGPRLDDQLVPSVRCRLHAYWRPPFEHQSQ